MESVYMHQPTLDKHYLGFHPQPPNTTPSGLTLQNPPNANDVEDEIALQSIVEDLQNLVLNQAFNEEVKAKSENEDEIAVQQIIFDEVRNLVLEQAFTEEGDIEISVNGGCCSKYGNVIDVKNEKGGEAGYEDVEHSWRENGNAIDVENEKGGEAEWGFGDDHSWSQYGNAIDVKNEEGGEAGLKEWGFSHYEDGHDSWRENRDVIDVENKEGGEAGSIVSGFYRYKDGDDSWRGNGGVTDVENEKGGDFGWGFNENGRRLIYPLRPDAMDCAYYIKTGTCQYGVNCKFNHPSRRRNQQWAMEKGKQKEESEERAGLIECKYYLTEGGCKYGNACKYYHSRKKDAISSVLDLNFLGLPIRPGEKDCPYYMRSGSCKYGSNCRFHHPDPTTVAGNNPPFGYNSSGSAPVQSASYSPVSSWSSPRASNETAPFLPVVYSTSLGIPPLGPQWNRFQAPVYPTSEKSLPSPLAFAMQDPATKANFYPRPQQAWLVEEYYPERPGQPDCSYFIKTGDCKYKSNCKFNHPKTQKSKTNLSVLSDKGLPLRPGQAVCSFYSRYGICKFGPACKFDHPEHNGNTASSPGFAFYQPPFGNSATTDGLRMARKGNGNGSLVQ